MDLHCCQRKKLSLYSYRHRIRNDFNHSSQTCVKHLHSADPCARNVGVAVIGNLWGFLPPASLKLHFTDMHADLWLFCCIPTIAVGEHHHMSELPQVCQVILRNRLVINSRTLQRVFRKKRFCVQAFVPRTQMKHRGNKN